MKTKIQLMTLFLWLICSNAISQQTQMKNWFIAPKKIYMPQVGAPQVTPIAGTPATATAVANGMYDMTGNLVFYIADGNVYDYNNTLIGTIPSGGAEVAIVPFGTNDATCQSKFNIFSTNKGFTNPISLFQSVLDMKSISLTSNEIDGMPFIQEFGAIAVGNIIPGSGGDRYMYFLAGTGNFGPDAGFIRKLLIQGNGTVIPQGTIYPALPYANDGIEVFARELDLSPNGDYLAWVSFNSSPQYNRYHVIELNPASGGYTGNYWDFNIPQATNNPNGFRGVEFYQPQTGGLRLFMGAGNDGIYYITMPNTTAFTLVSNSANPTDYGFSQIELAHNGNMFASSHPTTNPIGNIGSFLPYLPVPSILSWPQSFTLNTPNPPNSGWQGTVFYTLPDQIDGQDYSLITPAAVTAAHTLSSITISSSGSSWSYGTNLNPWNAISSNDEVYILDELRISSGASLVINNMKIKFSPNAKVVIENGSTLTLDTTTLTSCSVMDPCSLGYSWQGIELWGGANNENQITQPLAPGVVEIRNYSRIEYAQTGVNVQRPGYTMFRGGIMDVKLGSKFYNCLNGVVFAPYQNMGGPVNNPVEVYNRSHFSGARFYNDVGFIHTFSGFPVHIRMDGCNGIKINNCDFSNDYDLISNQQSIGIISYNSSFHVTNESKFEGLYSGISAYSGPARRSFRVDHSDFLKNVVGIRMSRIVRPSCLFNSFAIGNHAHSNPIRTGIRSNFCNGYVMEENIFDFDNTTTLSLINTGLDIINSGPAYNQIYHNVFEGLQHGIRAIGNNNDPGLNFKIGLECLCNQHINQTDNDLLITAPGIQSTQGNSTLPAGNTFSGVPIIYNINNSGSNIDYFHSTLNIPSNITNATVTLKPVANSDFCPVKQTGGGSTLRLSTQEIIQQTNTYDSLEQQFLNTLFLYNQLLDGGNTNYLLTQIQLNWSTDANTLFNELIALSPYLSQQTLVEVAMMDVLPHAMLLTVCMANPDAVKDESFLQFLQYEIPSPLPLYMINLIQSSWSNETVRTYVERSLTLTNSQMSTISNLLLRDADEKIIPDSIDPGLLDTINYFDQKVFWLSRIQNVNAKYELVDLLYSNNDTLASDSVLNLIPEQFELNNYQQTEYDDFVSIYYFRKNFLNTHPSFNDLDSLEKLWLLSFAEGEPNQAKELANNILCFYFSICADDAYNNNVRIFPSQNNSHSQNYHNSSTDKLISITPSPVGIWASIIYKSNDVQHFDKELSLFDSNGKLIKVFLFREQFWSVNYDTSLLKNGLYTYSLHSSRRLIEKGSFVINK